MADYSKDIINVLEQFPEGLPIRAIAKYVYNKKNSFFDKVDLEEVKKNVTNFLVSRSRSRNSSIVRTEKRGVYKLERRVPKTGEQPLNLKF